MVACPTELVKCRLQAQSALATTVEAPVLAGVAGVTGASVGTTAVKAVQYSGPFDVAKHVLKSEGGVFGLYKGLTPTLMREVPGNAAMFGTYEATKQYLAGGIISTLNPSNYITSFSNHTDSELDKILIDCFN